MGSRMTASLATALATAPATAPASFLASAWQRLTHDARWRDRLIVVLVGLILFLPGIATRDLWNPDEPRYVEVAREMLVTGQVLVPHLNGEIYAQKPPMLFWLISLSAIVGGGLGLVTSRIPILLAALGAMLVARELGQMLANRRVGLLTALILATSGRIMWQGRVGQIDMVLIFLVALAVLIWARGMVAGTQRISLWFWAVVGLATLTKGPVGLLIPLLAICGFCVARRDWAGLRRLRPLVGLGLWAAIVLAWLVPAAISGGQAYLDEILFKQNVTRYAASWHHLRPWYYYLTTVPLDFLPWTLVVPGAAVVAWRQRDARTRRAMVLAVAWAVTTVVFFSLSPGKRTVYVLPMFPALALLTALGLESLRSTWPRLRWAVAGPVLAGAALLAAPVGALLFLPRIAAANPDLAEKLRQNAVLGPNLHLVVAAVLGAIVLGLIGAGISWLRGRHDLGAGVLVTGMVVMMMLAATMLFPRFDRLKSARSLSERLVEVAGPEDPIGIYQRLDPRFVYHTRRFLDVVETQADLERFLSRPERVWLLAERDDIVREGPIAAEMVEVARDADPVDGYILFRNVAPGEPGPGDAVVPSRPSEDGL